MLRGLFLWKGMLSIFTQFAAVLIVGAIFETFFRTV